MKIKSFISFVGKESLRLMVSVLLIASTVVVAGNLKPGSTEFGSEVLTSDMLNGMLIDWNNIYNKPEQVLIRVSTQRPDEYPDLVDGQTVSCPNDYSMIDARDVGVGRNHGIEPDFEAGTCRAWEGSGNYGNQGCEITCSAVDLATASGGSSGVSGSPRVAKCILRHAQDTVYSVKETEMLCVQDVDGRWYPRESLSQSQVFASVGGGHHSCSSNTIDWQCNTSRGSEDRLGISCAASDSSENIIAGIKSFWSACRLADDVAIGGGIDCHFEGAAGYLDHGNGHDFGFVCKDGKIVEFCEKGIGRGFFPDKTTCYE